MRRVCIVLSVFLLGTFVSLGQATEQIKVNQVGYYVGASKLASVTNTTVDDFELRNAEDGLVVFSGAMPPAVNWTQSSKSVKVIDFSSFNTPGEYKIFINGVGESFPFKINDNVLDQVSKEATRYFYYNRSSTALLEEHAGIYAREGGHWDTSVEVCDNPFSGGRAVGSTFSSPGGWYDAGDYNKYLLTAGISTYTLLSTYEQYPEYVSSMDLNIPESSNNIPDLLDECLYEINWLMTMQDTDGGVYTKLSNQGFGAFTMPNVHDGDNGTRYVCGKNTSSTLQFAATLAAAYRIYEDFDNELEPGQRESWRAAAIEAWEWAEVNPNVDAAQCGCDITTGAYPDTRQFDEAFWSAAELYLATGDIDYYNSFNYSAQALNIPGWQDGKESLGAISLLLNRDKLTGVALADYNDIYDNLIARANSLLAVYNNHPYRIMMSNNWYWGSNGYAGNQAYIMLTAYKLSNNKDYLDAAIANIDYILGKNTTSYSWFTGFGSKRVQDAHHRISGGDGIVEPVPGMVFGGAFQTATGFEDASCCGTQSYANTEVTVNWNAPFAFSTIALQAINGTVLGGGYALNINVQGNGKVNVNPEKTTYELGDVVSLTAIPDAGNVLFQWAGDLNGNSLTKEITINRNTNVTVAFAEPIKIPGVVSSTTYNFGGAEVAYLDNDRANKGNGPRAGEAVDTEEQLDGSFNLGWIEAGEWVTYTVDVETAGIYDLVVDLASPEGLGAFNVEMDGEEVLSYSNISNTGDWTTFESNTITNVALEKGLQTMRINMVADGFNMGDLSFELKTPSSVFGLSSKKSMSLYPNPVTDIIRVEDYKGGLEITTIEGVSLGVFNTKESETIPTLSFNPGVYLIIPEDDAYGVSKFVKH